MRINIPESFNLPDFESYIHLSYRDLPIATEDTKISKCIFIHFTSKYAVEIAIYQNFILTRYHVTHWLAHLLPIVFILFYIGKASAYEKEVIAKVKEYLVKR